ncbi:fructosamine kinase family protein [Ekhidna sp.]|uniref:fructosamine kinase family protein n=1 Tax=Ekhidna sp. TaxID=2608089 RepID=UPI003CCB995A
MSGFVAKIIEINFPDQQVDTTQNVSGGCINNAIKVETDENRYFLKWNRSDLIGMFESESKGLNLLNKHSPIFSPEVIDAGVIENRSYLLTEWIDQGAPHTDFWRNFGINLARQHKNSSDQFGLDHDNYIGSLPQSNSQHASWDQFFIEERLNPQLDLAKSKGLMDNNLLKQFDTLMNHLPQLVPDERPALLHGDLWSGNYMIAAHGNAAVFDPAVHYGHRETELSFTKLFGGFSSDLYRYYENEYPLEPEFEDRVDIHNLYPLLVHVNLFGSSYLSGIIQTLRRFT